MQPGAGGDTRGMVLLTRGIGKSAVPVNSEAFWKRKVEDVVVDEVFFHKYFNNVAPKRGSAAAEKASKYEGDSEEEQNEEEIWKALVGSRPELEGDDIDADDVSSDDEDEGGDEDIDRGVDVDIEGDDAPVAGDMDKDKPADESDESPNFDDGDDVWHDEDEVPDDLQKAFEAELWVTSKKENAKEVDASKEGGVGDRKKRRKLKNLPTFASAEDYAGILSD